MVTLAPLLAWHAKVLLWTFASLNPSLIESATRFPNLSFFKNEIMEGPAPLIVTARAPASSAFFFN